MAPAHHKKQHFVPQFHLRSFAAPSGRLAVFDKVALSTFWSKPVDVGHENQFLTIPELDGAHGRGAFFESFFGSLENEAAAAIAETVDRIQHGLTQLVSDEARQAIAMFLAVQYRRTPEARERIVQMRAAMDRTLRELREEGTAEFKKWVDAGLLETPDPVREHSRQILNPEHLAQLSRILHGHVWLVYSCPNGISPYSSDHPLAMHSHVRDETRGFGPASFGTELQFPLGPRYLLCLAERRWIEKSVPSLATFDGRLVATLAPDNVLFQRSLQVRESKRFLYSLADDFDLAREMCEAHPDLRDPDRARIAVIDRGRRL